MGVSIWPNLGGTDLCLLLNVNVILSQKLCMCACVCELPSLTSEILIPGIQGIDIS